MHGTSGAAPGYRQYVHQQHQQQQQQQQKQAAGGADCIMAEQGKEDNDDDVLPGTPEEEQPANDYEGPSIIGMRGQ